MHKWEVLRATHTFSVPVERGRAAIFVTNTGYGEDDKMREYTCRYMQSEADDYANCFSDFYADVEVRRTITRDGIRQALEDPEVSGMIIIGEGNLSCVFDDGCEDTIRWSDISEWSTHLKQGVFFQRFCGNIPEGVPVPLGTFAMTSLSSVWAAVGQRFQPEFDTEIEKEFQSVSKADALTYQGIVRAFGDPALLKPALPRGLMPGAEALLREFFD
jgi:hypothetical protein